MTSLSEELMAALAEFKQASDAYRAARAAPIDDDWVGLIHVRMIEKEKAERKLWEAYDVA